MKTIRLIDRSRTVTDWKCPHARYLGYEADGTGYAPASGSLALSTGIIIHDALAAIATYQKNEGMVPIDTIAALVHAEMMKSLTPEDIVMAEAVEFAKEQSALAEGMIRGFHKHVWPRLMHAYPTIVAIEAEVEYTLGDGFIFMAKPDLLVEDAEGSLVYIEYKSTSSKQDKWINSWDTAVQLHSSIKAVEQTLGRAPAYVHIVGLYKGYESYGKQNSPFCYAYMKKGNPPFTSDATSYAFKAGFKRYPTWELEGGTKAWVETMPENILGDLFPMTPAIMVDDTLVERFFKQRLIREQEIAQAMQDLGDADTNAQSEGRQERILNAVFPQRFDQCAPSFGYGCEFKRICHGGEPDPLKAGFLPREPHHARELEQFNATV